MHKAPVTKLNRMTNRALPQMLVNVAGRLMDSATFFAMAAVRPSKSMIFMFHGIESAKDSYQYDNSTPLHSRSVFECFVAWLRQAARIVPLEDILCEPQSDDGVARAALTFDDGLLNHYTAVYPLLRELDARATFFVPSGLIGTPGQMTRAMIRELSAGGMSIGSHTVTHPALPALSLREAHAELYESKAALEDLTGKPCADLAYPYG
ncbi:MAG: polysaccharide deacetylase family protein, partial [Bryobacteraceae bacterium]